MIDSLFQTKNTLVQAFHFFSAMSCTFVRANAHDGLVARDVLFLFEFAHFRGLDLTFQKPQEGIRLLISCSIQINLFLCCNGRTPVMEPTGRNFGSIDNHF